MKRRLLFFISTMKTIFLIILTLVVTYCEGQTLNSIDVGEKIRVSYEEIRAVKNCAPRDSCFPNQLKVWNENYTSNKYGDWEYANHTELNDWHNRSCFCDSMCNIYEDCCSDSPYLNLNSDSNKEDFKCVLTRKMLKNKLSAVAATYYMKARCPISWMDKMVKKACEEEDFYDEPISKLPITNTTSGLTYRNYFCAICNYQSLENDMQFWILPLRCRSKECFLRSNYSDKISQHELEFRKDPFTKNFDVWSDGKEIGYIEHVAPENLTSILRLCNNATWTCPADYNNTEVRKKCRSYTSAVRSSSGKRITYRNVHCAICNGVDLHDLSCNGGRPNLDSAISFQFFDVVGRLNRKCPQGKFYDNTLKDCRRLICSVGQEEEDGKCNNIIESSNLTKMSLLNNSVIEVENCPRVLLDRSEYNMGDNGTIYYREFSKNASIIRMYSNDSVEVCFEPNYLNKFEKALSYLSTAGDMLSIIFLTIHLIVFMMVPDLQNLSGKCLASLCVALLAVYFICIGTTLTFMLPPSWPCKIGAVFLYYSLVAAFCWMLVLSLDVSITLKRATKELRVSYGPQWKRFIGYSIFGWGCPAVLAVIVSLVDFVYYEKIDVAYVPGFGKYIYCWFGQQKLALLIYFICPVGIILLVNLILFVLTAKLISSNSKGIEDAKACGPSRENFKLYVRLAVLMGISWIMGIIFGCIDIEFFKMFYNIFIMLNTLHGVFIFFAFTCTTKTRKSLQNKYGFSSLKTYSVGSLCTGCYSSSSNATTSTSVSLSAEGK